jgi:hypothetical protein
MPSADQVPINSPHSTMLYEFAKQQTEQGFVESLLFGQVYAGIRESNDDDTVALSLDLAVSP